MRRFITFFRELRKEEISISREIAFTNIRRIIPGAAAALVINITIIAVYSAPRYVLPNEILWSRYVISAHSAMAVVMAAVFAAALILRKRKKMKAAAFAFQYFVFFVIMAGGIALTAIDQLVTPSITPYMAVCVIIGTIFLIRPLYSVFIYAASYTVFFFIVTFGGHTFGMQLSNTSDGFAVTVVGLLISFVMWRYNLMNLRQRRYIEDQQKKLVEMAYVDPLTKLLNRRRFDDIIKNEAVSEPSGTREASLIMLDIDHFKNINDNFGHPAGDSVLIQLSRLLEKNIRSADKLCRLGGEEFIILLPGTPIAEAVAAAEKLRKLIEEYEFTAADNTVHMTASFGVSRLDYMLVSQYSKADKALYTAKRLGRNRVVSA